jgi:hypothetical protein
MRNDVTVLLAVLNFYVRIKIRVATFDFNHSVTDITQSIATSIQKLPNSAVKSFSGDCHRQSMCQATRSGYRSV